MMKKKTENKYAFVKQLVVLPLLAVLVMGLSNREVKTEIVTSEKNVKIDSLITNLQKSEKTSFKDFKIVVDGKEISTDLPEFKTIKLTEENNYNGRIAVEIAEALKIDLHDIRSSKTSTNSPNPFLFIRTKDYVEGSNPDFDKMMERSYAPPFFNASKPGTEGEKVITGKVTDEKGNPIEGASIEVKGRQFGVITDKNGNYKIEVEPTDEALIYGYLYLDKKEVIIGDKHKIDLRFKTEGNPPTDGVFLHNSFRMRTSNGELATPLYVVDGKEVVDINSINSDNIEKIDVLKGESGFKHYGEKGKNGVVLIYTKAKNNSQPEELNIKPKWTDKNGNHVFYKVEAMPEFPGGEMALLKYITNQTKYPEIARENGIQGKVYVAFIITKEGKVTEPSISRGVDPALDKEALRVIGSLPDWKPGKQGGQAVNVSYTVPITFGLQNQNNTKGNPLIVVDGVISENKKLEEINTESIESMNVLKNETAIEKYGEKGKNGVIEIISKAKYISCDDEHSFYMSVENSKVIDLRRKIAQSIKYPVAAQENNQQGVVEIWAFIAKDGTISRITDKRPDGKFINIDKVVVTALKSEKAVTTEKSKDLALLVKESKRVIEKLSPFQVPELLGEMVCFRIQFVLQ